MKTIPLTKGKFAVVDDSDFKRVSSIKWRAQKARGKFYAVHDCKSWMPWTGKHRPCRWVLLMHRFIVNAPPGKQVDHEDNDGLNNARSNLRICTNAENNRAKKTKSLGVSSRYRGVSFCKARNKWVANIRVNDIQKHLGRFISEKDAAAAYDKASKQFYGQYNQTNL